MDEYLNIGPFWLIEADITDLSHRSIDGEREPCAFLAVEIHSVADVRRHQQSVLLSFERTESVSRRATHLDHLCSASSGFYLLSRSATTDVVALALLQRTRGSVSSRSTTEEELVVWRDASAMGNQCQCLQRALPKSLRTRFVCVGIV